MTQHIDPPESGVLLEKPECVAARNVLNHICQTEECKRLNEADVTSIIAAAYNDREFALEQLVQAVTKLIPVCPLADRHPAQGCRYCRIIQAIDNVRRTTA